MTDYTPEKLERFAFEAEMAGKKWAEFVYEEDLFRERAKDFLAARKMEQRRIHPEASEAELDCRARDTEDWKNFRLEQNSLLKNAGRAKIEYQDKVRLWETEQSILAFKREEMKNRL